MKQNLDTKVKQISLLILKISFLTLHQINPIFGYIVKITPDINPINGLMNLSDECEVQYPPDIYPICGYGWVVGWWTQ